MTTLTETRPTRGDIDVGPVDHYYCCDEDVALCGTDLRGVPDGPEHDALCPICADLLDANAPCPVPTCPAKEQP
jgi:hypothetical protein